METEAEDLERRQQQLQDTEERLHSQTEEIEAAAKDLHSRVAALSEREASSVSWNAVSFRLKCKRFMTYELLLSSHTCQER